MLHADMCGFNEAREHQYHSCEEKASCCSVCVCVYTCEATYVLMHVGRMSYCRPKKWSLCKIHQTNLFLSDYCKRLLNKNPIGFKPSAGEHPAGLRAKAFGFESYWLLGWVFPSWALLRALQSYDPEQSGCSLPSAPRNSLH